MHAPCGLILSSTATTGVAKRNIIIIRGESELQSPFDRKHTHDVTRLHDCTITSEFLLPAAGDVYSRMAPLRLLFTSPSFDHFDPSDCAPPLRAWSARHDYRNARGCVAMTWKYTNSTNSPQCSAQPRTQILLQISKKYAHPQRRECGDALAGRLLYHKVRK